MLFVALPLDADTGATETWFLMARDGDCHKINPQRIFKEKTLKQNLYIRCWVIFVSLLMFVVQENFNWGERFFSVIAFLTADDDIAFCAGTSP